MDALNYLFYFSLLFQSLPKILIEILLIVGLQVNRK